MTYTKRPELMVRDHFYDLLDGSGPHRITSLHELAACLLGERPGADDPEEQAGAAPHVGSSESRRVRYAMRPAMSATS